MDELGIGEVDLGGLEDWRRGVNMIKTHHKKFSKELICKLGGGRVGGERSQRAQFS